LKRKGNREELEAAKAEAAQRVKRARLGKGSELSGVLGDHEGAASDEEGEEENGGRRGRKRPAAPMFTTVSAEEDEVHTVQLATASRPLWCVRVHVSFLCDVCLCSCTRACAKKVNLAGKRVEQSPFTGPDINQLCA
jgi:hypothetical protein